MFCFAFFVKSYPMQGSAPPGTWNLEPGQRTALRSFLVAPLMFLYTLEKHTRGGCGTDRPTPPQDVRTVHRVHGGQSALSFVRFT